ncbi:hypothetical protein [Flavobacterium sp. ZS1P14]|uniref:hypothetical protein n=1 Tax=Flavobacterium sp. ZS1P14 TaxID=3401729 RepID=UPI003AAC7BCD
METLKPLSDFFSAIEKDDRISITHIGIYAALLQFRTDKGFINPIQAFSFEIMRIAKISASNTYHKYLRELGEYGYIKYEPSFKRNQGSRIYFLYSLSDSGEIKKRIH